MSQKPEVHTSDFHENEVRMAGHAPYAPSGGQQHGIQMLPPGATVVVAEAPWTWTWSPLITSMVAFFLCPLSGFIGTVMGLLSYTEHTAHRFTSAKSKKDVALCCGITGIILGIIVIIIWIIAISLTLQYNLNAQNRYNSRFNNNKF